MLAVSEKTEKNCPPSMTRRTVIAAGAMAGGMALGGKAHAGNSSPWQNGEWLNKPHQSAITADALALQLFFEIKYDSMHFHGMEHDDGRSIC